MKSYKLHGQILTPLHIGDGTELDPYDYVVRDRFYKINLAKFLYDLSAPQKEQFNAIPYSDIKEFREFIRENIDLQRHAEYCADISPEARELYDDKIDDPRNQLLISPFIRSLNRPYIPGSSLKGAIRTAILFALTRDKPRERDAHKLEAQVLKCLNRWGYLDPSTDPFRAIKLSDSPLPEDSIQVERVFVAQRRDQEIQDVGIQMIREMTYSFAQGREVRFTFELRIDDDLLKKNKGIGINIDPDLISSSCQDFYSAIMQYDLERFFAGTEVESLYSDFLSSTGNKSFLLRLGWGAGFNSMTLNLKTARPLFIKSRRLTEKLLPLGWLKVEIDNL